MTDLNDLRPTYASWFAGDKVTKNQMDQAINFDYYKRIAYLTQFNMFTSNGATITDLPPKAIISGAHTIVGTLASNALNDIIVSQGIFRCANISQLSAPTINNLPNFFYCPAKTFTGAVNSFNNQYLVAEFTGFTPDTANDPQGVQYIANGEYKLISSATPITDNMVYIGSIQLLSNNFSYLCKTPPQLFWFTGVLPNPDYNLGDAIYTASHNYTRNLDFGSGQYPPIMRNGTVVIDGGAGGAFPSYNSIFDSYYIVQNNITEVTLMRSPGASSSPDIASITSTPFGKIGFYINGNSTNIHDGFYLSPGCIAKINFFVGSFVNNYIVFAVVTANQTLGAIN